MRLKRLELQGFKSFLDRTILTFEPGVTGVVGPNGCGKSNIVDAIQWVMGEQSAKHLRGESMTDVIFNGSDSRAATSMAEVTLVLDRRGVALSPQFAAFDRSEEIAVTRRVYRDGTGEFLINKSQCRLKDIHELFMDTGVGRRAYSIIEQGQIDRMINVKPEERRFLFEEVAGITKYKLKRKEAERKLELTRQNLLRLQDIIGELEKQIRSLKVQATRARKFKELKSELETVDLFLLGRNLYTHKKSLEELEARRLELVNLRSESDATFAQLDAQVTDLEILRLDQEKTYQELGARERDLSLLVQKLENQLNIFAERKKYLAESSDENTREETDIREAVASLHEENNFCQSERARLADTLVTLEADIAAKELQLKTHSEERHRAVQRKDSLTGKRNQITSRGNWLDSQKQNGEYREREILESRSDLDVRFQEIVAVIETHRQRLQEVDSNIESCAARTQTANLRVSDLQTGLQQVSQQLSEQDDKIFKSRETFHSQRSRMQSLEELQQNLEGYAPSAREVLLGLEGTGVHAVPLAEVLQPEADIEDHLELLLGPDLNTLLVKTTEEAEKLSHLIEERGSERVRILALDEVIEPQVSLTQVPGAVSMLSKIRVQPGYEKAANWWLGNAFLCDKAEEVFAYRTRFPDVTLLSRDGRTIGHDDHSLSSGTLPTKMGVFARRREIEELTVQCRALEENLAELAREREALFGKLQSQEKLHAEEKDRLSSLHIESVECRKEKEKVQIELSRGERDHSGLSRDLERNDQQLNDIRSQLEKWAEERLTVTEEEMMLAEEIEAAAQAIERVAQEFEAHGQSINENKIERSRIGERRSSFDFRMEKIKTELDGHSRRLENLLNQRMRDQKELETIEGQASEVVAQKEVSAKEKDETLVRISDMKAAFNETCTKLQDYKQQRGELQTQREEVMAEIQEIELKAMQENAIFENLKTVSAERYQREAVSLDEDSQLDIQTLPLLAAQVGETWETTSSADRHLLLDEHLKNIKEKVGRYGEVNLTAITEFDEVQKRYDFLIEQRADLDKSIGMLDEAITKIDESTKVRFAETFDAVNSKFKEIFPILFNGGKAELTLTDGANILECGVDILVHPPGKRPASITLLSGGEKALTAVSLILAIFARKPSPFCLLDEVDAPLDDANVSRFNTVVKKMAEKTQFIVITHNKKTMEIAEALYGVTMEKAGISKMTSVRLN